MLVAKKPRPKLPLPRQRLTVSQDAHETALRKILVCVHNGDIHAAHAIVDDIAKASHRQVRYRDIHIADTGVHQFIVADLDRAGVYTVGDLFNSSAERLMTYLDVGNVVKAMARALRTICEMQDLPAA